MSALLFNSVQFDSTTSLYTYNYAVENNSSSTIWNVDVLVGNTLLGSYGGLQPLVPAYTAPEGWTMYGAFSGSIANSPYNESGGFYEWYGGNQALQPWSSNFGFSFTTSFAPTMDGGNNYFLYGSDGIVGYGNVVVPDGAEWMPFPPTPQYIYGSVPEPSTWALLLLGFILLASVRIWRLCEPLLRKS